MAYPDLIQHLLNVNIEQGIKFGLENVQRLQKHLNFPDLHFKSIHVAGTNGKGSVCIKTAYALEKAGYRVGLFTSPHISSYRERIRINGKMITEEAVEAILPSLFQLMEEKEIPATFFEVTTLLAFLYFAQEKVDFAVLETGLGGRLDATNVIKPCLSIITSISLDHTDMLGLTREEIAQEKGGIIKERVPVIIGPHVPLEQIKKIAEQKKSPCTQVKESSLLYETENRSIAKAALNYLAAHYSVPPEAIEQGLEAKQPCRFEILEGHPAIVLDVAHNPDGIAHLFQSLKAHFPKRSYRLLFGLSKSKDVQGCLKELISHGTHFHLVESTNGRGASKESLQQQLLNLKVQDSNISLHNSITAGVQTSKEEALKHNQILVIFGTFFIMGEVRQALGYQEPVDSFDLNEKNFSCLPR